MAGRGHNLAGNVSTYAEEIVRTAAAAASLVRAMGFGEPPPGGSLTVIGTGIRAIGQLTVEALAAMANAEVLLHVIGEPIQEEAIRLINPAAETLTGYYVEGMDRSGTYEAMVEHILGAVASGRRTVVAFYGHPGVFTYPSHESVRRARAAGYPARMLPAVSAEDCLFADLGVDPGEGCQSQEATDFLFSNRPVDVRSHLVLWQVGTLANWTYEATHYNLQWLPALAYKLAAIYGPGHPATVYEAPFEPTGAPRIDRLPVAHLHFAHLTPASTLYLPPLVPL